MAGQIILRGERTWLVRVFLGRDSQTGKHKYHNKTIRGNRRDAQKYLNGMLRDLDLGTFVEPSPMTLNEYLERFSVGFTYSLLVLAQISTIFKTR
jgi:integrase